jgi:hypothetical protein
MTTNLPFEVKRLDGRFTHFYKYHFRYYLHFEHYEKKVVDTIESYLKSTYGNSWPGTSSWSGNIKRQAGWDAQFPNKKSTAYRIYLRDEDMLNYVMMIL